MRPISILRNSSGCRPVHIPDMDSACKIKMSFLRFILLASPKAFQFRPRSHSSHIEKAVLYLADMECFTSYNEGLWLN